MIYTKKMTAKTDGDFVVFLIGMRINKWWKVHKWLPLAKAMPKMIQELEDNPELGLLHHEQWFGRTTIMVQYWKSFEHLEQYAKSATNAHLPAWKAFNQYIGENGDIGIWHETYLVSKGQHESIYNNMPAFGLAKATNHVEINAHNATARDRVNR